MARECIHLLVFVSFRVCAIRFGVALNGAKEKKERTVCRPRFQEAANERTEGSNEAVMIYLFDARGMNKGFSMV